MIDFYLDEIISADETGINYGLMPMNQYVPEDAQRGAAPDSDDKARITAMLWGTADGTMQEMYIIIKCSAKGSDLSNTRVIKNLHEESGFKSSNGWKMGIWVKTQKPHPSSQIQRDRQDLQDPLSAA